MKKIYTLIFGALLLNSGLKAQLTLTKALNEPTIGNTVTEQGFDSTSVVPKNTGPAQTWNFSSFTSNTVVTVSTYTTVSSTPKAALFPAATIAQSDGNGNYTYFQSTASNFELNGIAGSAFIITFTNNAIAVQWPVSYLYNNTDIYSGVANAGTLTGVANGTITTTAPGNGTVMLPGGLNFSNCLQVKSVNNLKANVGTGFTAVTLAIVATDYTYYSATQKFPILTTSYSKQTITSILGPTVTATATIKVNSAVYAGINEFTLENLVTVYPNPTTDFINVSFNNNESSKIEIYNQLGQVLITEIVPASGKQINISSLNSGVYFLRATVGNKTAIKKLIKE